MRLALLLVALVVVTAATWTVARPPVALDDLGSPDPDVSLAANRRVEDSGGACERVLLEGMSHPSTRVRALCMRHLGRMRANAAVPGLQRALHDPEPTVRVQAAVALRGLRSWTDVGAVEAVAADPAQPPRVREPLILALGKRRETRSIPFLLDTARRADGDVSVRTAAVDALGCIARGDAVALDTVRAVALDPGADIILRQHAMMSMANMHHRRSAEILEAAVDDPALPMRVRGAAAFSIGRLGDPGSIPFLAARVDNPAAPMHVRVDALSALLELGGTHPVDFLEQALRDRSLYVRTSAVRAIVRAHGVDLIDVLTEAAAHEPDSCARDQMTRGACRLRNELEQEEP